MGYPGATRRHGPDIALKALHAARSPTIVPRRRSPPHDNGWTAQPASRNQLTTITAGSCYHGSSNATLFRRVDPFLHYDSSSSVFLSHAHHIHKQTHTNPVSLSRPPFAYTASVSSAVLRGGSTIPPCCIALVSRTITDNRRLSAEIKHHPLLDVHLYATFWVPLPILPGRYAVYRTHTAASGDSRAKGCLARERDRGRENGTKECAKRQD